MPQDDTQEKTEVQMLEFMQTSVRSNRDVLNTLKAEYEAKMEMFKAQLFPLEEKLAFAQEVCDMEESAFRAQCLAAHEETGDKKLLGGIVTIQERKQIEDYDKDTVGEWIKSEHPAWVLPDFKMAEKAAKLGIETPLTVVTVTKVAVNMDKVGVE